MDKDTSFTYFDLSRSWFNFSFENPEKVNPNHTALYLWLVELNNRMGWSEHFSSPATQSMAAIGIKSYNTYKKTFDELVSFGFIKVIKPSINQYQAVVIALSRFNKARNKALDKALTKHATKQVVGTQQSTGESNCDIDKPRNQETKKPRNHSLSQATETQNENKKKNKEFIPTEKQQKSFENFMEWMNEHAPSVAKLEKPLTVKELCVLMGVIPNSKGVIQAISKDECLDMLLAIENNKEYLKKYRSPYLCITNWHKKNKTSNGSKH